MPERKEKSEQTREYRFISETIKKRPVFAGVFTGKSIAVILGCVLVVLGLTVVIKIAEAQSVRLRTASEMLSTGKIFYSENSVNYLGIRGITVSQEQSETLEIPKGIYVDTVENDSPAMEVGIQSGDIIYKLGETELETVQEYTQELQELEGDAETNLSVYRRNGDGEYESVEFDVTIEQR